MSRRQLTALIAASALITLDGTATTIALPSIGTDLSSSLFQLQWISNAPLLVLAALLLPAGALADRFGRVRVIRLGLMGSVGAAVASSCAPNDAALIAARFLQGAGGALVLPASLALLRSGYSDAAERTRIFGVWAAWTGVASAAGPLIAGALVDGFTWRYVFVPTAAAGVVAIALLERETGTATHRGRQPIPLLATIALVVLLGAASYLLMLVASGDLDMRQAAVAGTLTCIAAVVLARDRRRWLLVPRELRVATNCWPANIATFALYVGLFGLSFLLSLYAQQVLEYSAFDAALALLPISAMMFLAEPFGRLASRLGSRALTATGTVCAAAGLAWLAAGPHPLPFWSHVLVATALFGLGLSLAVSALTHAAVAAVPENCAGAASGLNHAVVRAAGLVAIALLGSLATGDTARHISTTGFSQALFLCATIVAAGGLLGSARLRDEKPGGLVGDREEVATELGNRVVTQCE